MGAEMGEKFLRKALAGAALAAVALVGIGAGAASAGEITGNGTPKEVHGRAECAFSGQNDEFHLEEGEFPRVQSFGQIVRFAGPLGGVPGFACNPTRSGA